MTVLEIITGDPVGGKLARWWRGEESSVDSGVGKCDC